MAFIVPGLQRKLDILIARGGAKDKKEVAERLGISVKTLNWYAHGAPTREAGLIPYDKLDGLIEVFAACFPPTTPVSDIDRILRWPVAEFEREIDALWAPDWESLVAERGVYDVGKIIIRSDDIGLVELEPESDDDLPLVPFGSWFRLEFQSGFAGIHLLCLQLGGGLIGNVPVALDDIHDRLVVPGYEADRELGFMRERRDDGVHQFFVIQTRDPLPQSILQEVNRETAIEPATLKSLAAQLASRKPLDWKIFVQRLRIEA